MNNDTHYFDSHYSLDYSSHTILPCIHCSMPDSVDLGHRCLCRLSAKVHISTSRPCVPMQNHATSLVCSRALAQVPCVIKGIIMPSLSSLPVPDLPALALAPNPSPQNAQLAHTPSPAHY